SVQATVGYTLDLAGSTPLRVLSSVKDGLGNPVPHNATWRLDGEVVGTTTGTTALTIPPQPSGSHPLVAVWTVGPKASGTLQLQAFARRDVSGSGGSAAGVGGAIAQTTLRVTRPDSGPAAGTAGPAKVGGAVPVILGLSFDRRAGGTTLAWGSSVPATGSLLVHGPGGAATRDLPVGVRFSADLGDLPDGVYDYNLTARDEAGRAGFLAGQVRFEGTGTGVPLPTPLVPALAAALEEPLAAGTVFLVDQDRDGHADHVVDASGLVVQVRALPQQGRFVLHSIDAEALFLLEANTGNVRAMQAVSGVTGEDASDGGGRHVAVAVAQKAGWILVTVRDPHPGERLLGAQRGDGTPLPAEAVWRGNGVVQFVDDPAATYSLLYAAPAPTGISLGLAAGLVAAGLLVGALAMLLLRRRIA
ncbi:MAG: hypothetical protein QOI63_1041, partial [Thermoplasmata archaeon]|nr:hypothetical protein [Thermoplasmata archaeon]